MRRRTSDTSKLHYSKGEKRKALVLALLPTSQQEASGTYNGKPHTSVFLTPKRLNNGVQHGTQIRNLESKDKTDQQCVDTKSLNES